MDLLRPPGLDAVARDDLRRSTIGGIHGATYELVDERGVGTRLR